MAQQNEDANKKTVHAYQLKALLENGEATISVTDSVTKKKFEAKFNKDSFPKQEMKDVFAIIKKALESKSWAATFPQNDGEGLYVDIEDGALEFELPEVEYDE